MVSLQGLLAMQIINMYRLDAMDARTEHHQRSHHAGVCRGVAALLWMSLIASVCLSVASGRTHGMSPRSAPDKRREAIQRLSRVFEIERLPQHRQHRTPSDCMTALYNRVAYSDGISRSANPFDADLVRGFPDRGKALCGCVWLLQEDMIPVCGSNPTFVCTHLSWCLTNLNFG